MTTAVFDKALELVAPGAAITATGNATGVLMNPRMLPVCDWVIYLSGVVATGTYVLNLQVSDVVGGTYTTIATVTWPPAIATGRIHLPISGQLAAFLDTDNRFMRIAYTLGGTTPSMVIGSFLAKAATNAGLGARVGDFVNVG